MVAPTSASLGSVASQIPPMAEPALFLRLPSASTSAPFTPLRSNGVAPFRATCLRLAPPPRPLRCPAPFLRRSSSRPFRRSSSPADCPTVRSSWSLARLGKLTFALRTCCRSLLRGSCLRLVPRLRQNPLRRSISQELRAPSLRRPQPTFAFFCSGSFVRPVPLRLGADPSQAQDQPPGSALPRTSFVAYAASSRAPSPSLPSHSCRKLFHSAARPLSRQTRFTGLCREPCIVLR